MKTLILIRHAKSDWPENTPDTARPLANRGNKDAQKMAKYLAEKVPEIDLLVASPAVRTVETCKIFAKQYHLPFTTEEKLYHPSPENFLSAIFSLDDAAKCAALFSHNEGISDFGYSLSAHVPHFPTCGVAVFQAECEEWSSFEGAKKQLLAFYKPKDI